MYCTIHFVITIFNVDNVLLCVIYQLNSTVFMHVTRISRYMTLYVAFGIIHGFPWPQYFLERITHGYGGPPVLAFLLGHVHIQ